MINLTQIPKSAVDKQMQKLLYSNLLILANVFWRAIYSFYQSHRTILYNYNIYRCSSVCLFTSNDGDELWREHRINSFNTGTGDIAKYFSLAHWFGLKECICLHQSPIIMTHMTAHYRFTAEGLTALPNVVKQKHRKNWHALSSFT